MTYLLLILSLVSFLLSETNKTNHKMNLGEIEFSFDIIDEGPEYYKNIMITIKRGEEDIKIIEREVYFTNYLFLNHNPFATKECEDGNTLMIRTHDFFDLYESKFPVIPTVDDFCMFPYFSNKPTTIAIVHGRFGYSGRGSGEIILIDTEDDKLEIIQLVNGCPINEIKNEYNFESEDCYIKIKERKKSKL